MVDITEKMTIKDVAEELGVSESTVSRAISGKGRIGETTRKKVLEFIKNHNYIPGTRNGSVLQKTHNIGWVMPDDCNIVEFPFFQRCMMGLLEATETFGYNLMITTSSYNDISHLQNLVNNNKADGVVLARTNINDMAIHFLKEKKTPFITIGTYLDAHTIQIDHAHRAACKEFTAMQLNKGYKKIGLIGGSKRYIVNLNRYQGYEDALIEAGRIPDQSFIYMDVENYVAAEIAVEELIKKKADCILCTDDAICMYVINKLNKEKLKIPQDIKVGSFYNSSLLENNDPAISCIDFDAHELGNYAGKILIDCIEGREININTLLGYEISTKESTKSYNYTT